MTLEELDQEIQNYEHVIGAKQRSIENMVAELESLKAERKRMMAGQEVPISLTEAEIRKLRLALGTLNQAWPSVDNFDLMAMLEKAHHLFCKE